MGAGWRGLASSGSLRVAWREWGRCNGEGSVMLWLYCGLMGGSWGDRGILAQMGMELGWTVWFRR